MRLPSSTQACTLCKLIGSGQNELGLTLSCHLLGLPSRRTPHSSWVSTLLSGKRERLILSWLSVWRIKYHSHHKLCKARGALQVRPKPKLLPFKNAKREKNMKSLVWFKEYEGDLKFRKQWSSKRSLLTWPCVVRKIIWRFYPCHAGFIYTSQIEPRNVVITV